MEEKLFYEIKHEVHDASGIDTEPWEYTWVNKNGVWYPFEKTLTWVMTDDELFEKFDFVKNHIDENASYDGHMFETYGEEDEYVRKMSSTGRVMTLVDGDGEMSIVSGWYYVNRMGYFILDRPLPRGLEIWTYEEEGELGLNWSTMTPPCFTNDQWKSAVMENEWNESIRMVQDHIDEKNRFDMGGEASIYFSGTDMDDDKWAELSLMERHEILWQYAKFQIEKVFNHIQQKEEVA